MTSDWQGLVEQVEASQSSDHAAIEAVVERILQMKPWWKQSVELPDEVIAALRAIDPTTWVDAVEAVPLKGLANARVIAALVGAFPTLPWRERFLLNLGRFLPREGANEPEALSQALGEVAKHQPALGASLLRALVLDAPIEKVGADALFALSSLRTTEPLLFVRAVKRAAVAPEGLSLRGVFLLGLAEAPPDSDSRIELLVRAAVADMHQAWVVQAGAENVLSVISDVLKLTSVLLDEQLMSDAVDWSFRLLDAREWPPGFTTTPQSPLNFWGIDVERYWSTLPEMILRHVEEREQRERAPAEWNELSARLRDRTFARPPRRFDKKQGWRIFAPERMKRRTGLDQDP